MSAEKRRAHDAYKLPEFGEPCTAAQRATYHAARAYGFWLGMARAVELDDAYMGRMATGYVASIELAMAWAIADGRMAFTATNVNDYMNDPDLTGEVMTDLCRDYGVDMESIEPYGPTKAAAS